MMVTKAEFLSVLRTEIRLLLHLISKVDPTQLDFRPTRKQRTLLELLQYLTIMGPIHVRGALADSFDMGAWGAAWNTGEEAAKQLNLAQIKESIASQSALFEELLESRTDAFLRGELEMFGSKSTRGAWLVSLVLSHYAAYRMQLFQYLKSSGQEQLNTFNLWVGVDGKM